MNRQSLSILMPQSVDITHLLGGRITSDSITTENVSGLLAQLSDQASAYIRIKYLLENHYRLPLIASLIPDAVGLIQSNKKFNKIAAQSLVEAALDETCSDNICATCCGAGVITAKSCPKCNGTGRVGWSNVKIAQALGVNSHRWKSYLPLYLEMKSILDGFEIELSEALRKSSEIDASVG